MNNHENIPDLAGKVAIVTGSNSGTGYGIASHLAKHGCTVIMASRNEAKLQEARSRLLGEVPGADLRLEIVDLADLDSIRRFCDRITGEYDKVDFLANNAGGGPSHFMTTDDGLEGQMAVNYFGHVALTIQLLPVLRDGSRVVTFSSMGYKRFLRNDLDVDNLQVTRADDFNQMQEYCKAKLCSILFAVKLQREFERIGSTSMSLACHPGWARTNLGHSADSAIARFGSRALMRVSGWLRLSHDLYHGALPAVEALIADNVKPDKVYAPGSRFEATGAPVPTEIDDSHFDPDDIDKLWAVTQALIGVDASDYLDPQESGS